MGSICGSGVAMLKCCFRFSNPCDLLVLAHKSLAETRMQDRCKLYGSMPEIKEVDTRSSDYLHEAFAIYARKYSCDDWGWRPSLIKRVQATKCIFEPQWRLPAKPIARGSCDTTTMSEHVKWVRSPTSQSRIYFVYECLCCNLFYGLQLLATDAVGVFVLLPA
eukprot:84174-Amphidinium_carterae.1